MSSRYVNYFPYSSPEIWLIKTELMKLITSKPYQDQIICRYGNKQNNGTIEPPDSSFSYTVIQIMGWFEYRWSTNWFNRFDSMGEKKTGIFCKKKTWTDKINEAMQNLIDNNSKEKPRVVEYCALFWIAQYSLLKTVSDKKIDLNHWVDEQYD
ncbi:MAG: hypothetical protein LBH74_09765 [Nitrososphaerota archaeon]|jgi:hypothetical protein|nr:hypothetical protein [Nitrososphaerota archaeon]